MPFTNYMRSSIATLVALTSLVAYAQTSATKTQTVILVVKGESHVLRTTATTVGELLEEQHVVLTEQLLSSAPLTSMITEGMQVSY